MTILEVIVIIIAILIVALVFGNYAYKKITKKPTGECACCKSNMKSHIKRMKKELRKEGF